MDVTWEERLLRSRRFRYPICNDLFLSFLFIRTIQDIVANFLLDLQGSSIYHRDAKQKRESERQCSKRAKRRERLSVAEVHCTGRGRASRYDRLEKNAFLRGAGNALALRNTCSARTLFVTHLWTEHGVRAVCVHNAVSHRSHIGRMFALFIGRYFVLVRGLPRSAFQQRNRKKSRPFPFSLAHVLYIEAACLNGACSYAKIGVGIRLVLVSTFYSLLEDITSKVNSAHGRNKIFFLRVRVKIGRPCSTSNKCLLVFHRFIRIFQCLAASQPLTPVHLDDSIDRIYHEE